MAGFEPVRRLVRFRGDGIGLTGPDLGALPWIYGQASLTDNQTSRRKRGELNVAGLLLRSAKQHGAVEAVRFGNRALSYGELAQRAGQLAKALETIGLAPGDRVAVLLRNGPELVESMFGAWIAGLVVVPINYRAHIREVAYIVENCSAGAVICGVEIRAELTSALPTSEPALIAVGGPAGETAYESVLASHGPAEVAQERQPTDPAWLFYTSGTTGKPKGAILSHRNLRQMVLSHLADVRSFRPGETVLHAAPLTHGSGMVMLACVARGARNLIYHGTSFDGAAVLDLVRSANVTSIAFVAPTQIVVLNRTAGFGASDLPLESVCYGGAPMFTADLLVAMKKFGAVFVQIYGQGEAPMTITALDATDHARFASAGDQRIGSVGLPRTDVEISILDDRGRGVASGERGEVVARGDVVMEGYWDAPDATSDALSEGWLRTGDIGRVDQNGYLFLLDRSKDLIISGGNNIYPREVEEAILSMPAVRAVAVIGIRDDYWGESVHALVVTQDGKLLTVEQVIDHCRGILSSYKKPRSVEFVSELPVNAYGKVLKRELRERQRQHSEGARSDAADSQSDASDNSAMLPARQIVRDS